MLVHFFAFVSTQFSTNIKDVQCDSGCEFDNTTFARSSLLMVFISACRVHIPHPRTVELNASFIPLTLLGIPSCFRHLFHLRSGLKSFTPPPPWINILPTKTLKLSTPQFALYGAAPSYDHLRVFGCKCYPNLSATAPHKLSPRSTKCVFFGLLRSP